MLAILPAAALSDQACPGSDFSVPPAGATSVEVRHADVPTARFPGQWQQGRLGDLSYRIYPGGLGMIGLGPHMEAWRIEVACDSADLTCRYRYIGPVPADIQPRARQLTSCLLDPEATRAAAAASAPPASVRPATAPGSRPPAAAAVSGSTTPAEAADPASPGPSRPSNPAPSPTNDAPTSPPVTAPVTGPANPALTAARDRAEPPRAAAPASPPSGREPVSRSATVPVTGPATSAGAAAPGSSATAARSSSGEPEGPANRQAALTREPGPASPNQRSQPSLTTTSPAMATQGPVVSPQALTREPAPAATGTAARPAEERPAQPVQAGPKSPASPLLPTDTSQPEPAPAAPAAPLGTQPAEGPRRSAEGQVAPATPRPIPLAAEDQAYLCWAVPPAQGFGTPAAGPEVLVCRATGPSFEDDTAAFAPALDAPVIGPIPGPPEPPPMLPRKLQALSLPVLPPQQPQPLGSQPAAESPTPPDEPEPAPEVATAPALSIAVEPKDRPDAEAQTEDAPSAVTTPAEPGLSDQERRPLPRPPASGIGTGGSTVAPEGSADRANLLPLSRPSRDASRAPIRTAQMPSATTLPRITKHRLPPVTRLPATAVRRPTSPPPCIRAPPQTDPLHLRQRNRPGSGKHRRPRADLGQSVV